MPPDVLARAFNPFFTTKNAGKGTGLGLSQLYGFARQSGGTARIESEPGTGTVVTIYLPRTTAEAPVAAGALAERHASQGSRVLIADDDGVRNVAAQIVEELGYRVSTASGGREALAIIEADAPDLLITDIVMPETTGVDLAREVRARWPMLPILFASGYADVKTFGEELGDETVLKKPSRIAEVAARLHEMLERERTGSGNVVELRRR